MAKDLFHDAVAAIYDAALQPKAWTVALSRIGELIGGSWLLMSVLPLAGGADFSVQDTCGDEGHLAYFRQHYNRPDTNPSIPSLLAAGPGGIVLREDDMSDEEWVRCGLYNDVYRPAGIYHGLGAFVLKTDTHMAFLGVNRRKAQGQFTSADIGLLRQIMPHIERALQVFVRVADLESQKTAHEALWDTLPFGLALLDRGGKILWTNQEATSILTRADGLSTCRKFLAATNPAENAELQRIIRVAIGTSEGRATPPRAPLNVSRPSHARPLALLVTPMRMERSFSRQPVAAVFITDPERAPEAVPEMLKRLYELTPRESTLATLLLQGIDLREAAEQMDVSMNTARTHLRLIFEKTDTHRQSELVHLLLRGPAGLI